MTATTARALANGLLLVAVGLLAVDLAAMVGWLPRIHDRSGLWLFAFVCLVLARIMRRRSRNASPSVTTSP